MQKLIFILILAQYHPAIYSQNWASFSEGTYYGVMSLFHDSIDNILYIGGGFYWFDSLEAKGLVKWDGQEFSTVGVFPNEIWGIPPSSSDAVMSIIRYKDEIYCTLFGYNPDWYPNTIQGLARWDGVSWDSVAGIDGIVFDQIIFNDELYILGNFVMADNDTAAMVIRWDGENWHDTGFASWIGGYDGHSVYGAAVFNGELYVGGNFWNDDFSIQDIAKFDGTNWHTVAEGIKGGFDDIGDIIVYKDELYICGDFKKSSGNAANAIMKLKDDHWVDVGGSLKYGGSAGYEMFIYHDRLYMVGGIENEAGGVHVNGIAVWDGERWCSLGSQFDDIIRIAVEYKGDLIIGGDFDYIDGVTMLGIARWTGGDYLAECGDAVATVVPIVQSGISIFPNPAYSQINISASLPATPDKVTLKACNLLGQSVWQEALAVSSGEVQASIDVSGWQPGVYFISLSAGGEVWVEKVIVH